MTRCLIVSRIVIWVAGVLLLGRRSPPNPPTWEVPRMADGRPDLQGIWTNATLTPVERPDSSPDSAVLTAKKQLPSRKPQLPCDIRLSNAAPEKAEAGRNVGAYNNFWMDRRNDGCRLLGAPPCFVVHPRRKDPGAQLDETGQIVLTEVRRRLPGAHPGTTRWVERAA